jgi:hypothetical protein
MNTALVIYLAGVCDSLLDSRIVVLVLTALLVLPILALYDIGKDREEYSALIKKLYRAIKCGLLFLAFLHFVPSKKTVAMMYIIPKIEQSDFVQNEIPELYEAAKQGIKNLIKKEVAE